MTSRPLHPCPATSMPATQQPPIPPNSDRPAHTPQHTQTQLVPYTPHNTRKKTLPEPSWHFFPDFPNSQSTHIFPSQHPTPSPVQFPHHSPPLLPKHLTAIHQPSTFTPRPPASSTFLHSNLESHFFFSTPISTKLHPSLSNALQTSPSPSSPPHDHDQLSCHCPDPSNHCSHQNQQSHPKNLFFSLQPLQPSSEATWSTACARATCRHHPPALPAL